MWIPPLKNPWLRSNLVILGCVELARGDDNRHVNRLYDRSRLRFLVSIVRWVRTTPFAWRRGGPQWMCRRFRWTIHKDAVKAIRPEKGWCHIPPGLLVYPSPFLGKFLIITLHSEKKTYPPPHTYYFKGSVSAWVGHKIKGFRRKKIGFVKKKKKKVLILQRVFYMKYMT